MENHWGLLWNSFSTHNSTRHQVATFPTLDQAVKKYRHQIKNVSQGQTYILGYVCVCTSVFYIVQSLYPEVVRHKLKPEPRSQGYDYFFSALPYFSISTKPHAFNIMLNIMKNISIGRDNITCLLLHHIFQEESFMWNNQSSFWNRYNPSTLILSISWGHKKKARHDLHITHPWRREYMELHRKLPNGSWVERHVGYPNA